MVILENRTRWRSADLEAVILGALLEAGITAHGRDRVVVTEGYFSGWCYVGKIRRFHGRPRMTLRIPEPDELFPDLDVARFVWLVRHEVGHWRGLEHLQMATSLRFWHPHDTKLRRAGPFGRDLPLPAWAVGLEVRIDDAPVPIAPKPDRNVAREQKRDHASAMLAKSERKAKLAATLVKRWRRRLAAADRALLAASRPR